VDNNQLELTLEFNDDPTYSSLSGEEMLEECRSLAELISDNAVPAKIAETDRAKPGEKGIELLMSTIVLPAVTCLAAKTILECIKLWLGAKKRRTSIRIRKGGVKLEVHSTNLDAPQLEKLSQELTGLLAD